MCDTQPLAARGDLPDTLDLSPWSVLRGAPLPARPYPTVLDALRQRATSAADALLVGFLGDQETPLTLSCGAAWTAAQSVASGLMARGLRPGDAVLIMTGEGRDFVAALFGVWAAGGVAVPYPPPFLARGEDMGQIMPLLGALLADCGARWAISDAALAESLVPHLAAIGVEACSVAALGAAPLAPLPAVAPDAVALLQYTSGPSLAPRGVVLRHDALMANVLGIGQALDLGPEDLGVTWLPLFQDMALVGVLLVSLVWGFPSYFMRPEAFLLRPLRWLKAIAELGATLSAAPSFAYRLCARRIKPAQAAALDLSRWRVTLNGAEAIDVAAARDFEALFAGAGLRPGTVVAAYGLAENALAVSAGPIGEPLAALEHAPDQGLTAWLGAPIPGQCVAITAADGTLLPRGQEGEIRLRSASLMAGYHGKRADTAAVLVDGWLRTGDLGVMDEGRLAITGRCKDLIIKRGRNYYPEDVEHTVAQVLDLPPAAVVAFAIPNPEAGTEDLVVLVEAVTAVPEANKAIDTALLALLGIRVEHLRWVLPGSIVCDPSGRTLRGATRTAWLAEQLPPAQ